MEITIENENQKRILLIIANEMTRETFARLFRQRKIEVIEAGDGIEAMDAINGDLRIDLVMTGVNMPRMGGTELIKALKSKKKLALVPIYVYANLGEGQKEKAMRKLGIRDFIVQGTMSPVGIVDKVMESFGRGNYLLRIDPLELDGQKFLQDMGLPGDMICPKCKNLLAFKFDSEDESCFRVRPFCEQCDGGKEEYKPAREEMVLRAG